MINTEDLNRFKHFDDYIYGKTGVKITRGAVRYRFQCIVSAGCCLCAVRGHLKQARGQLSARAITYETMLHFLHIRAAGVDAS